MNLFLSAFNEPVPVIQHHFCLVLIDITNMSARSSRGHNAAESPTKTANAGNGRSGRTSSGASPASSIVLKSTATRHRGRPARKRSFSPDDGSGDVPCSVDEAGSSISECISSSSISDQSERSFQKRSKDLDQSPEDEDGECNLSKRRQGLLDYAFKGY